MSTSRYDFIPYPWPVKPALLFLLGLSRDASQQEYEKAWQSAVAPAAQGEWAKYLFYKEVSRRQDEGRSFEESWVLAKITSPGRELFAAWQREIEAKKTGKMQ